MKRTLFLLASVVCVILLFAATQSEVRDLPPQVPAKKSCTGYEVIEAGKGINCYGDTIKLTRRSGFYEVASNVNPNNPSRF